MESEIGSKKEKRRILIKFLKIHNLEVAIVFKKKERGEMKAESWGSIKMNRIKPGAIISDFFISIF